MSVASFLAVLILLISGATALRHDRRVLGGALMGLSIAVFTALMPWRTVEWLSVANRDFGDWYLPRRAQVALAWTAASACLGAAAGLGIARSESKGSRPAEREIPKDSPAVENALRRALAGGAERTLIGVTALRRSVCVGPVQREGHMQIVGPTRSGKSQLLLALAAQDMARGYPVFLMEAKGDRGDFDQFLKSAALSGRQDRVLYFNPQDPRSMSFNPIRPVPGQDPVAVANQVARAIGREPTSSGEGQDYYRGLDYAKVQTMAEVFCRTGKAFTLRDCFYYFAFEDARDTAFELCDDKKLVELARAEFEQSPDSSALTSALRPWTTGTLGELLNSYSPQVRLEDIFERGLSVYFAVPVGHLQVLANPLGRMVISGLLSLAASRQGMEPKPKAATVILDEFAEFATPVFASFVATVGSARLRTVLSHQDLGQLKRVEGMDKAAFNSVVFNNTSGCKICFRSPAPEDAEFWALSLGTDASVVDTERVSRGLLGDVMTGERSRREVEQFKVHPNRLKSLPPGVALVVAPGTEECLVRTARVRELIKDKPLPALTAPAVAAEAGLDLRAKVKGSEPGFDHTGGEAKQ